MVGARVAIRMEVDILAAAAALSQRRVANQASAANSISQQTSARQGMAIWTFSQTRARAAADVIEMYCKSARGATWWDYGGPGGGGGTIWAMWTRPVTRAKNRLGCTPPSRNRRLTRRSAAHNTLSIQRRAASSGRTAEHAVFCSCLHDHEETSVSTHPAPAPSLIVAVSAHCSSWPERVQGRNTRGP